MQLTPTFDTLDTVNTVNAANDDAASEIVKAESAKDPMSVARSFVKYFDEYHLDGIIGMFVPAGGDVVTGVGSMGMLVTALRERVPTVILFRMILNILIGVLIGAIPILGDVFDFFWRSNKRNLNLIEKYRDGDEDPGAGDYAIAIVGMLLALLAMMVPFLWIYGTYTALGALFQ